MPPIHIPILVLTGLLLSSCSNYLGQKSSLVFEADSSQEEMSFDFLSVRDAVFSPRCTSCHQQYETYQGVVRELSAIQSAVATNRMPKTGGPLTEDQKSILATWIANGAPEKNGASNPPFLPAPLAANWKSVSERILFPKCLICHNPQGQAKFLDLSSREQILTQSDQIFGAGAKLINFDSPDESYILQVIQDAEEPMPPTWSNIPRLTSEEIKLLREWIALGLP